MDVFSNWLNHYNKELTDCYRKLTIGGLFSESEIPINLFVKICYECTKQPKLLI